MQIAAIVNLIEGERAINAEEAAEKLLAALDGNTDEDSCTVTISVIRPFAKSSRRPELNGQ